jgi:hypothetical protein
MFMTYAMDEDVEVCEKLRQSLVFSFLVQQGVHVFFLILQAVN